MRWTRFTPVALIALATLSSGCSYNKLQRLDEQINQAQGQIKVQYQRRADLIGNLVATVKGMAHQEDTVFLGIAQARAKLAGAAQGNDVNAMGQANAAMAAPLSRLLALSENYPTLTSSANFRSLQDEIAGTENRVAVARTDYNTAVQQYNSTVRQFPTNITAKVFGMGTPRPYFDVQTPGAEKAPTVDFH